MLILLFNGGLAGPPLVIPYETGWADVGLVMQLGFSDVGLAVNMAFDGDGLID